MCLSVLPMYILCLTWCLVPKKAEEVVDPLDLMVVSTELWFSGRATSDQPAESFLEKLI